MFTCKITLALIAFTDILQIQGGLNALREIYLSDWRSQLQIEILLWKQTNEKRNKHKR